MEGNKNAPPLHRSFMRRQAVAYELGVTRHTLSRIIKSDARFPVFFEISPGIEVIERRDFEQWIQFKKLMARNKGQD